jgi:hypothetical protein
MCSAIGSVQDRGVLKIGGHLSGNEAVYGRVPEAAEGAQVIGLSNILGLHSACCPRLFNFCVLDGGCDSTGPEQLVRSFAGCCANPPKLA